MTVPPELLAEHTSGLKNRYDRHVRHRFGVLRVEGHAYITRLESAGRRHGRWTATVGRTEQGLPLRMLA
ncbi:hypothetical protein N5079_00470 [Planotetraspora sp. A-T 1434]|uniref:hypothetical protein n=1 Tax=Planotetraspora sp. A-T 1434 TaxID=2979219 RepID=UPI0021BDF51F|nr:hypothetical protein [Planotetraspora sp. A-T 1434]MCT9928684.1 hypothetical protein [Planotetraspora sp. A-T 1434]